MTRSDDHLERLISRKLDGETSFTIIGSADAKTKSYVDATIPTGIDGQDFEIHALTYADVDGREEDEMDRRVTWIEQGSAPRGADSPSGAAD